MPHLQIPRPVVGEPDLPWVSSLIRILSGRSIVILGAASISGVPALGLPKINSRRFFSLSTVSSTEWLLALSTIPLSIAVDMADTLSLWDLRNLNSHEYARKSNRLPLPGRAGPGTKQSPQPGWMGAKARVLPDLIPEQAEHDAMRREERRLHRPQSVRCQTRVTGPEWELRRHAAGVGVAGERDRIAPPQSQIPSAPNRCESRQEKSARQPASHAGQASALCVRARASGNCT